MMELPPSQTDCANAPASSPSLSPPEHELKARNGLDNAVLSVDRVKRSLLCAAELLRDERVPEGERCLVRCLDSLDRVLESLTFSKIALGLDFSSIKVEGRSLEALHLELAETVKALRAFCEAKDWQPIADRIEYQLLDNLNAWLQYLPGVK